jgi:hypothetical protein
MFPHTIFINCWDLAVVLRRCKVRIYIYVARDVLTELLHAPCFFLYEVFFHPEDGGDIFP